MFCIWGVVKSLLFTRCNVLVNTHTHTHTEFCSAICPSANHIPHGLLCFKPVSLYRVPRLSEEQHWGWKVELSWPLSQVSRFFIPSVSELCSKWAIAYLVSFYAQMLQKWARSEPESGLAINVTQNCQLLWNGAAAQATPYSSTRSASWSVQTLSAERLRTLRKATMGLWKLVLGDQLGGILDISAGSMSWFEKILDR